jgi:hydrogenase/urease accessory protein HupE
MPLGTIVCVLWLCVFVGGILALYNKLPVAITMILTGIAGLLTCSLHFSR